MNIFSEIEGLRGEDFTTSILRYLLLQSQDLRESFIRLVSTKSKLGPVLLDSHFTCIREYPTENEGTEAKGRLDLLIETDDFVIGVENKFDAIFQDEQPQKYQGTLKKYAQGLSQLPGNNFRNIGDSQYFVVVIAPKRRKDDIERKIRDDEHLTSLTWEEVLDAFQKETSDLNKRTKTILDAFLEFVKDKIDFLPDFKRIYPHLRNRFDPHGSALQRKVVAKLWDFFPDPGPKLSCSKTWVGYYYFSPDPKEGYCGWYGFVSKEEIKDNTDFQAELIVSTSFNVTLDTERFRRVELRNGWSLSGTNDIKAWAVKLDKPWDKPEYWENALAPINEAVQKLKEETESET